MTERIERMINAYNNHVNSWRDSLRTYENGLNNAASDDIKLVKYWNENIAIAKWKIESYSQVVLDLNGLLDK